MCTIIATKKFHLLKKLLVKCFTFSLIIFSVTVRKRFHFLKKSVELILDLVTNLVSGKSVTKSRRVTKSLYRMDQQVCPVETPRWKPTMGGFHRGVSTGQTCWSIRQFFCSKNRQTFLESLFRVQVLPCLVWRFLPKNTSCLGMESGLSPVRKSPVFLRKLKSGLLGPKSGLKRSLKLSKRSNTL